MRSATALIDSDEPMETLWGVVESDAYRASDGAEYRSDNLGCAANQTPPRLGTDREEYADEGGDEFRDR